MYVNLPLFYDELPFINSLACSRNVTTTTRAMSLTRTLMAWTSSAAGVERAAASSAATTAAMPSVRSASRGISAAQTCQTYWTQVCNRMLDCPWS